MNKFLLYLHRKSREEKFRLFQRLMKPTPDIRILNVGASGANLALSEQFETCYAHRNRIVGGGISFPEAQDYRRSFPGVKAAVFDGCALPFPDKSFDIVFSNAVIEHLPGWEAQQKFAAEMMRVGRGWFVTPPNLLYPVEPHYHLPLIQFLPQQSQRKLVKRIGKVPYDNLYLLTKRRLRELFPRGRVVGCRVTFYSETLIAYLEP